MTGCSKIADDLSDAPFVTRRYQVSCNRSEASEFEQFDEFLAIRI
uniref:Uncharacterized protein n=1 Tax=Mycolicibacterium neoaurum VKM Ac-1815D TaxID=700508 RepID=V5XJ26_MYCNE